MYEQSDLRIEVVELTRLAAIKSDEREQKARDYMRAELRYHRALDDLKSRDLAIIDNKKKYQEMMTRFVSKFLLLIIKYTEEKEILMISEYFHCICNLILIWIPLCVAFCRFKCVMYLSSASLLIFL